MSDFDLRVRDAVTYDPETGKFFSEYRLLSGRIMQRKFTYINKDGYLETGLFKKCVLLHRLAWFCHFGNWPDGALDHVNRVKTDNRIANLRLATPSQNAQNRGRSSRNKAGFKGVFFNNQTNKFQAAICTNYKTKYLGAFDDPADAAVAYDAASRKMFGEFAVTNFAGEQE